MCSLCELSVLEAVCDLVGNEIVEQRGSVLVDMLAHIQQQLDSPLIAWQSVEDGLGQACPVFGSFIHMDRLNCS